MKNILILGKYWTYCWKFAAPLFLLFIIGFGLYNYEPLQNGDYVYPPWANFLGWSIAISSMSMIPLMGTYKLLTTKGTFMERMKFLTTPVKDHPIVVEVNGEVATEQEQVRLTNAKGEDV